MGGWDDFIGGLKDITGVIGGVVEKVEAPVNHIIDAGDHIITHTEDKIADTIDHTEDSLSGVLKNLSMPLMIGGAVVLIILLKK
jgi:hypothetical protein